MVVECVAEKFQLTCKWVESVDPDEERIAGKFLLRPPQDRRHVKQQPERDLNNVFQISEENGKHHQENGHAKSENEEDDHGRDKKNCMP